MAEPLRGGGVSFRPSLQIPSLKSRKKKISSRTTKRNVEGMRTMITSSEKENYRFDPHPLALWKTV